MSGRERPRWRASPFPHGARRVSCHTCRVLLLAALLSHDGQANRPEDAHVDVGCIFRARADGGESL